MSTAISSEALSVLEIARRDPGKKVSDCHTVAIGHLGINAFSSDKLPHRGLALPLFTLPHVNGTIPVIFWNELVIPNSVSDGSISSKSFRWQIEEKSSFELVEGPPEQLVQLAPLSHKPNDLLLLPAIDVETSSSPILHGISTPNVLLRQINPDTQVFNRRPSSTELRIGNGASSDVHDVVVNLSRFVHAAAQSAQVSQIGSKQEGSLQTVVAIPWIGEDKQQEVLLFRPASPGEMHPVIQFFDQLTHALERVYGKEYGRFKPNWNNVRKAAKHGTSIIDQLFREPMPFFKMYYSKEVFQELFRQMAQYLDNVEKKIKTKSSAEPVNLYSGEAIVESPQTGEYMCLRNDHPFGRNISMINFNDHVLLVTDRQGETDIQQLVAYRDDGAGIAYPFQERGKVLACGINHIKAITLNDDSSPQVFVFFRDNTTYRHYEETTELPQSLLDVVVAENKFGVKVPIFLAINNGVLTLVNAGQIITKAQSKQIVEIGRGDWGRIVQLSDRELIVVSDAEDKIQHIRLPRADNQSQMATKTVLDQEIWSQGIGPIISLSHHCNAFPGSVVASTGDGQKRLSLVQVIDGKLSITQICSSIQLSWGFDEENGMIWYIEKDGFLHSMKLNAQGIFQHTKSEESLITFGAHPSILVPTGVYGGIQMIFQNGMVEYGVMGKIPSTF